ncbi:MAG: LmbE family N-acetylglucosaminyl deacetylase [Arcticibacterium sp.]|jgi:LmbE family N-acetylglucosaminyl deacetylase
MKIKYIFLVLLCSSFLLACQTEKTPERILAIFAHPDDETTIGPVLAKYAQTDSVYLLIATDGQFGVTEHAGIPAGDSLVAIRKLEAECSCRSLGIHAPIILNKQDGLGLNGQGDFYKQVTELKVNLLEEIQRIKPTKIITFGAEGDTGHPDHRMVGNLTTEVLLQEGLIHDIDLYYFGWIKAQSEKYSWWELNYVHESGLDRQISYSENDKQKAIASINCYESQFSPEEINRWVLAENKDKSNQLFFRKFIVDQKKHSEL